MILSDETKKFIQVKLKPLLQKNDFAGIIRACQRESRDVKSETFTFLLEAGVPLLSHIDSIPRDLFVYSKISTITIPSNIFKISDNAFTGSDLKAIKFEEGIEEIGREAFAKTKLTSASLPESLKRIGADAFKGCTQLIKVYIPKSITALPKGLFDGCPDNIEIHSVSRKGLPPSQALRCPASETEWYKKHLKLVTDERELEDNE